MKKAVKNQINTISPISIARDKIIETIKTNLVAFDDWEIRPAYQNSIDMKYFNEETEEEGYIYISVIPSRINDNQFVIRYANINLPKSMQRTGVFTEFTTALLNMRFVESNYIESVLTDAMKNFCLKNGYKEVSEGNYCKWKNHFIRNKYVTYNWLMMNKVNIIRTEGITYADITDLIYKLSVQRQRKVDTQVRNWFSHNLGKVKIVLVVNPSNICYVRRTDNSPFGKVPKYLYQYLSGIIGFDVAVIGELPAIFNIQWTDTGERDTMTKTTLSTYYEMGCRNYGMVTVRDCIDDERVYVSAYNTEIQRQLAKIRR